MRSFIGIPYICMLQHMVTLTATKARHKPPRASLKRLVQLACQLLHSGEVLSAHLMAQEFQDLAY